MYTNISIDSADLCLFLFKAAATVKGGRRAVYCKMPLNPLKKKNRAVAQVPLLT